MLCEKCRIREANVRYTEIRAGGKKEHNLCAQCAAEMNFGPYTAFLEGEINLGKLLSGLMGLSQAAEQDDSLTEVVCPTCGTTYQDFVDHSRFGCADCYHVFDMLIGEKIKKLQDSANHTGKTPKMRPAVPGEPEVRDDGSMEFSRDEKVRQLERALKEAVRTENYEQAAVIRDSLRKLRGEESSC